MRFIGKFGSEKGAGGAKQKVREREVIALVRGGRFQVNELLISPLIGKDISILILSSARVQCLSPRPPGPSPPASRLHSSEWDWASYYHCQPPPLSSRHLSYSWCLRDIDSYLVPGLIRSSQQQQQKINKWESLMMVWSHAMIHWGRNVRTPIWAVI